MFPELFHIGSFVVTSFGAMVALGALIGLWIFARELQVAGLPPAAVDAAIYGIIGGFIGAKLLYVFEHVGEAPFAALLFARGGLSWFGGVAGGIGAGALTIVARRLPIVPVLAAATPALAIGHAIGRIGCFLVGDDYGSPSTLPWAVAFPRGLPPTDVPVHPTQIYELVLLVPLAWLLVRMRRRHAADRVVLGTYMLGAGAIRFVVEWFRVDRRVALDMSVAHWASLLLMLIGLVVLFATPKQGGAPARRRRARMTGRSDVPALRHRALDRFHDPFVRLTLPERAFKRALIAQARIAPGLCVLDIGCGTGRLLSMIRSAVPGARAVGIDLDPGMLSLSRGKITPGGTRVVVANATATALPFTSGAFDRVLSTLAFHHWNSSGKRAALAEVRRVLRPGGELHVADWGAPHSPAMRVAARLVRRFDGDEVTADNLEGRISRLIEEAGFVDVIERDRWKTLFGTLAFWSARI